MFYLITYIIHSDDKEFTGHAVIEAKNQKQARENTVKYFKGFYDDEVEYNEKHFTFEYIYAAVIINHIYIQTISAQQYRTLKSLSLAF